MLFIDNTAHSFVIDEYQEFPFGYEYEMDSPEFWFKSDYSNKLSVDNWYVKPIRFILEHSEQPTGINISISSNKYKLYKGNFEFSDLTDTDLSDNIDMHNVQTVDSIYDESKTKLFDLYTFYIFVNSNEEGTWMSRCMINIEYSDRNIWCPITVCSTFVSECEQLTINGHNMGINLPKEIIDAVYNSSIQNSNIDLNLYNIKMKEYLLNYMGIRGQLGSYDSVFNSLEWFGWGDKITVSKLLRTDNEFAEQYIRDYFDINTDILESYKHFQNSQYISLSVKANVETGKLNPVDTNDEFYGEGMPILENLFDKELTIYKDDIPYIKKYYKFAFGELSVKLSCLSYMLHKYFLPLHILIHSASIENKVYANQTKYLAAAHTDTVETPLFTSDRLNSIFSVVTFDEMPKYYIYNHQANIDENMNIFSNNEDSIIDWRKYPCAIIPIEIKSYYNRYDVEGHLVEKTTDNIYNCIVVLEKENIKIFESSFMYSDSYSKYLGIALYPYLLKNNEKEFWTDGKFTLHFNCNGRWYRKEFELTVPEMKLNVGKLKYEYDYQYNKQIDHIDDSYIEFNAKFMHGKLAEISDLSFFDTIQNVIDNAVNYDDIISDLINKYNTTTFIPNLSKYYNDILIYDITDINSGNKFKFIDEMPFGTIKTKYDFKQETISFYRKFFDDDGTEKHQISKDYDLYIMQDNNIFYAVFISKYTCDNMNEPLDDLIILDDLKLQCIRRSKCFLIERMDIMFTDNRKFEKDDIIVTEINNFDLPYNSVVSHKWSYNRVLGNETSYYSNTTIGIMPTTIVNNFNYLPGYYKIIVNYTLDDYFNNMKSISETILVQK